jgi:hypothetical protein
MTYWLLLVYAAERTVYGYKVPAGVSAGQPDRISVRWAV